VPFIVLYDANALYPNSQRDLLIRIARAGLVQAKWSQQVVEETVRALARNLPNKPKESLERLAGLINESVPDCLVTGYEPLIEGLKLPDPDDRHVLAAAIKAGAQVIVTANLKDFPADDLRPWNVEAKSPDDFVLDQIHINDKVVFACVQQIADSRKRRPASVRDVLGELERSGLVQSVAALRAN
jgi:predicted nucleic acid-binding protein